MRRVDAAFPDLLPIAYSFGSPPKDPGVLLDPVQMRLCDGMEGSVGREGRVAAQRRPIAFLVHAAVARAQGEVLTGLLTSGCGALLVLDGIADDPPLPAPRFESQIVVLGVWLPAPWGDGTVPDLGRWRARDIPAGVLLALGPAPGARSQVAAAVRKAHEVGAAFVAAAPLSLTPRQRQRVWESLEGEPHTELEDLLFHTDPTDVALDLERTASQACAELGIWEGIPGPATAVLPAETLRAVNPLYLWARRLDLLDGVSSLGWQLRRAARALASSSKQPRHLLAEGNLRVVPGFTPWVEAFARSLWEQRGQPFDQTRRRWLDQT